MKVTRKSIYRSKRLGKTKVRLNICISKSLWEKVNRIAPKVFGVNRGALSYAIEEALKYWLYYADGGSSLNPRPNVRDAWNAVVNKVRYHFDMIVPATVPHNLLLQSTMQALGVKTRSATDWIFKFYTENLIKPYSPKPAPTLIKPSDTKRVRVWEIVAKEA